MTMDLNKWLKEHREIVNIGGAWTFQRPRPRITCADGVSLSVQAGELLYSTPRQDFGPYSAVEVGFPSILPEGWDEWAETKDTTETVWGYIPIEKVEEFIDLHGGIA